MLSTYPLTVYDLMGMSGTALVVLAYILLQMEKLPATGLCFNLMNLAGAVLLLVSLWVNFNLASFVIEIFCIGASLIGLYRYCRRRTG